MIRTIYNRRRNLAATAFLVAISLFVATGCDDGGSMGSQSGEGRMIITMHDAPVDEFEEIWLTVESVTLIRSETEAGLEEVVVPMQPLRMNFLELDSVSTILVAANVSAGHYSKIRLEVSDPLFVRDDDSTFTEPDVQIVANGHVDINLQQGLIIEPETITAVDLDLDLEDGIQITATGNGRYILRPQIIVDTSPDDEVQVVVENATITSINLEAGTLVVDCSGAGSSLVVELSSTTEMTSHTGLPLEIGAVAIGSRADIEGVLNVSAGVVTASAVSITL